MQDNVYNVYAAKRDADIQVIQIAPAKKPVAIHVEGPAACTDEGESEEIFGPGRHNFASFASTEKLNGEIKAAVPLQTPLIQECNIELGEMLRSVTVEEEGKSAGGGVPSPGEPLQQEFLTDEEQCDIAIQEQNLEQVDESDR